MTELRAHRLSAFAMAFAVSLLALAVPGCKEGPKPEPGTVDVQIGGRKFRLEIADTRRAKEHGLMHRVSLPEDRGMIFVFNDEVPRSFWMKNVAFPLDCVYLDSRGKVVAITQMEANEKDATGQYKPTPSGVPARYAIELNKGAAAAAGLKVGDVIQVPSAAQTARE